MAFLMRTTLQDLTVIWFSRCNNEPELKVIDSPSIFTIMTHLRRTRKHRGEENESSRKRVLEANKKFFKKNVLPFKHEILMRFVQASQYIIYMFDAHWILFKWIVWPSLWQTPRDGIKRLQWENKLFFDLIYLGI